MTAMISTKDKITNALISLLHKRDFSEIKTIDIIRESRVSHQTFYRLFSDKYQLAEKVCFDMFYHFQLVYGKNASWKDLTLSLLNIIRSNSRFFIHLTSCPDGSEIFRRSLEELSKQLTGDVGSPPVYYIWLCIINEWNEDKFQAPAIEMYKKLCSYLPISEVLSGKELDDALKRYESLDMQYYIDKANS